MGPAAVLSILVKTQGAQAASTQLRSVDKAGKSAGGSMAALEKSTKRTSKTFSLLGSAAKTVGPLLGAVGVAKAVGAMNSEFREAQKVGAQTTAVLKSTGGAAKVTQKHIENLAGAISRKAGIDDEAIQSSENMLLTFTKVRNEVGKGNQIFDRATQTVTDMSVALGQSGKSSAIQLGKALNDPIKGITALRRVGVSFTEQQQKQIETLVKSGDTLGAQKLILQELNKEFGGSAAAQATAGDKLKVSLGNLAEAAGGVLVPQLDKAAVVVTRMVDEFVRGEGIAKVIIPAFIAIRGAVLGVAGPIAGLVRGFQEGKGGAVALVSVLAGLTASFLAYRVAVTVVAAAVKAYAAVQAALDVLLTANPIGLIIVALAGLAVGLVIAYKKSETFRDIVNGAFNAVKKVAETVIGFVKQHWLLMVSVLAGPFGLAIGLIIKHFGAIKDKISEVVGWFKALPGRVLDAVKGLGSAVANGIVDGLGQLGHMILHKVKDAADWVKDRAGGFFSGVGGAITGAIGKVIPGGDGLGRSILPSGGAFGGSLMGAQSALRPFAAIGSRFGLSVSSGRRPGSITSSGNISYHSSGEAIDMSDGRGPDANKLNFFKYMKGHFGGRLAELIYTPGGLGIKDGKPFRYTGKVAADHFDHVHVAFDTGAPGVGDGLGRVGAHAAFMGDGIGQIKALWTRAGGSSSAQNMAAAIAMAESSGNPNASNRNGDGSIDRGLWQINSVHGAQSTFDRLGNARAAVSISGNGRNWNPWTVFRSGAYKKFLSSAGNAPAAKGGAKGGKKGGGTVTVKPSGPEFSKYPDEATDTGLTPEQQAAKDFMDKGRGPGKGTKARAPRKGLTAEEAQALGLGQDDPNQPLIDAIAELAKIEQQKIDLETQVQANQLRILALANQGPQLLGAVIAAVNGGIGGQVGLGLQTPGYAGAVANYGGSAGRL